MIPNKEGWYYLSVKKISAFLWKIMSKIDDDFDYLSSFV